MHIKSFRVINYKCFLKTDNVGLSSGFNIIVGRNDAGKSALLEAIGLTGKSKPHKSLSTTPKNRPPTNSNSTFEITYELSKIDTQAFFSKFSTIHLPAITDPQTAASTLNKLLVDGMSFTSEWRNEGFSHGRLHAFNTNGANSKYLIIHIERDLNGVRFKAQDSQYAGNPPTNFSQTLADHLKNSTYSFKAERLNVGECRISGSSELLPDAGNLADVLNQLSSSNPPKFERFMEHVRTVFPHITQVTSSAIDKNTTRILIWTIQQKLERADLAIPLSEGGTGIGQVLAMLYIVITSDEPKIIIIDEPQSFLHPGAVRKLFEILRQYPHQYIVTTHSPLALGSSEEDRVLIVRREDSESFIKSIDPHSQDDLRLSLAEVGARLSDVFGADSILWVEGKTEEVCFPEIIKGITNTPLKGTQILGVISTDELIGPKATNRILEIYERLSTGATLLPSALAFIFDKEGRSTKDMEDIDRRSDGKVKWLPFRLYENYLLSSQAIEEVFNKADFDRDQPIAMSEVEEWLKDNGGNPKYFDKGKNTPYDQNNWRETVHGAQLLDDLFAKFSENRVKYDKVKHGLQLTRHLINSPTEELRALANILSDIIKKT